MAYNISIPLYYKEPNNDVIRKYSKLMFPGQYLSELILW